MTTQHPSPARASVSVVILTKNEAENLDACLASVSWADEVLVYDSGSTDTTLEIAERYGVRVHRDPHWEGFGPQRQKAQALLRSDWVLMVDADERVTPALRAEVEQRLAQDRRDEVYLIPRLTWCFGAFMRHSGWYPDYVLRLYPRERAGYNDALVHEKVIYSAPLQEVRLTGDLLHHTYRDLEHYLVKSAGYAKAWADQRRARGRQASLTQGLLHGLGCFLKMYLFRAGFLDGRPGLLLALLSAHSTFAKYADLWLRDRPQSPPPID